MISEPQAEPEDIVFKPEYLSDLERFQTSREKPYGIETKRGIIKYHNELVDYGQKIELRTGDNKTDVLKKTIFYGLVSELIARNLQQPIRLLDLGCGSGQFLRELKDLFGDKIETYGITARAYDRSGKPIMEKAEEQVYFEEEKKNGINMQVRNMSDLSCFSQGFFDLVVSVEGINYAGDSLKVIEQTSRVLKNDGLMLAGPVAISIEGIPLSLAGNTIFSSVLMFRGLGLINQLQNIPLKADVVCFTKSGLFSNPRLHFSHSAKSKNGAVYKVF